MGAEIGGPPGPRETGSRRGAHSSGRPGSLRRSRGVAGDAALQIRCDALVLYFGAAVGVMRGARRGEMAPDGVRLH